MACGELEEGPGTVRGNHRLARFQEKLPFIRNRTEQDANTAGTHTGLGKKDPRSIRMELKISHEANYRSAQAIALRDQRGEADTIEAA